ncbi:MAG: L,D-transpeptidase family protein [Gammaproteobacteria bacterium]|nr:L,D-transpeptidase family protein [Gammaproteobacteria bacterium]
MTSGNNKRVFLPAFAAIAAVLIAAAAHAPSAGGVAELTIASSGGGSNPALSVATTGTIGPVIGTAVPHPEPELRLINVIETFRRGEVDSAMNEAQELLEANPNFRLAHLVYGDLLASRAGVPMSFQSTDMPSASVGLLMAEAKQRWKHYRTSKRPDRVPEALVQMSGSQKNALVVDLAESRLFVFENKNGEPELLGDYYVSGGKNGAHKQRQGDRKTPVGVYFVIDRLPGDDLPDKYGPVAFPVDYPNEWDVRHGRTGGGIWLHGVSSSTYSRPPLDSDGCVALSNAELELVAPLLQEGSTPVLIADGLSWVSTDRVAQRRADITSSIEQWRTDWESGEVDTYLGHYSGEFHGRGMNKKAWDAYKSNVTRNKRFIRVGLDDISVFAHPFEDDMMVVSFRQQYESDRFSSSAKKRQYWRLEDDGRWRIISEENVAL